ncbi:redoxin domain-containing protein [Jatrophihabitans telluris]|uniref:Redoxin domain-containing protein n=1 Tax=Jatrophihabitans telluris TaxID=2038343 RepID=A0ABY4QY92_9ACTN|nr:thioredoxin-like domain-containing protein [Jatrophihabitans telluris]UQX88379.1 redoxin domain-containing protein [Jatrophihabitans telluris]
MTSLNSPLNRARVRAPEFPPGTWLNTAPAREPSATPPSLSLKQLRGRIVLLDFWTFCCGNCLHVIDELRELEAAFPEELVIIGVHSPKFEHEKSDAAVEAATERYEVRHPVFNDPELHLWRQYAIRAWPTLVLIDPNGYIVAQAAGEGQVSALQAMIGQLVATHDADGSLRRGDNPYVEPPAVPGTFRFPAKVVRQGDRLWVADAGHHQLVATALDGVSELARIGTSARGRGPDQFDEPNGIAILPPPIAARVGFDLVVADTGSHTLRGVDSVRQRIVRTIDLATALAEARTVTGKVPAVLSPWDVLWWPARNELAIAAAGVHLLLSWNPDTDAVTILAGTTVEGLKDGPALDSWLAQPSGLAVDATDPEGPLWFVDSETSALRCLTPALTVHTVIGEGLFDFGLVDGPAESARLQHPLGVAVLPDRSIAVADTYNGAVRRFDPTTGTVQTLATGLAEPSGVVEVDGELVVVESTAHRLTRPLTSGALTEATQSTMRTQRPVTELRAGAVLLRVPFRPAPGRKLDDRFGPSTRLTVSASPPELLAGGGGDSTELVRTIVLSATAGATGVLQVTAQAASCDDGHAVEHPACYLARQDWGIPVQLDEDGATELELPLLG